MHSFTDKGHRLCTWDRITDAWWHAKADWRYVALCNASVSCEASVRREIASCWTRCVCYNLLGPVCVLWSVGYASQGRGPQATLETPEVQVCACTHCRDPQVCNISSSYTVFPLLSTIAQYCYIRKSAQTNVPALWVTATQCCHASGGFILSELTVACSRRRKSAGLGREQHSMVENVSGTYEEAFACLNRAVCEGENFFLRVLSVFLW